MQETLELRVNYDFAYLLFHPNEGKNIDNVVKLVNLPTDDPRLKQIPKITKELGEKYDQLFHFGWHIKRKYSVKELSNAKLFLIKFKKTFEPCGEECGTIYNEENACVICGENSTQMSVLKLNSIPKKDISITIAGEVVVSEKFKQVTDSMDLKGIITSSVLTKKKPSNYFQLTSNNEVNIADRTVVGINPFDLSDRNLNEIYKCPLGHTIGLNLISELYVKNNSWSLEDDFWITRQKIGVKRGYLRPQPQYLCSSKLRNIILEEKLSGFDFEIVHIDE